MSINWTVRLKNPLWWAQVAAGVFLPILAYYGLNWEDMTSWAAIWDILVQAVQNPVVVIAALTNLWSALTDPTTAGMSDSKQAMTYTAPKRDEEGA